MPPASFWRVDLAERRRPGRAVAAGGRAPSRPLGGACRPLTRVARLGIGMLALLGAFVAFMIFVGAMGEARPEVDPLPVEEALASGTPADRWGSRELYVSR